MLNAQIRVYIRDIILYAVVRSLRGLVLLTGFDVKDSIDFVDLTARTKVTASCLSGDWALVFKSFYLRSLRLERLIYDINISAIEIRC